MPNVILFLWHFYYKKCLHLNSFRSSIATFVDLYYVLFLMVSLKILLETGEITQRVKVLLLRTGVQFQHPHAANNYNHSARRSSVPFWLLWAPHTHMLHKHTFRQTLMHINNPPSQFLKRFFSKLNYKVPKGIYMKII